MIFLKTAWVPGMLFLLSCTGQNGRSVTDSSADKEFREDASKQADILFDSLAYDFGTIIEGEKVVCYFDYENSGKGDLVISSVEATCGCTTPDWNREPLKPGEHEQMKVVFNSSGRSGSQRKSVTVSSNAATPIIKLSIKANVINNK
ncbi:MAG: DUF1573 domain-containing protein [Bacteroidetes bacterium]|nr:DUF1573 domain-containing protein [Bacteroidota bacterium]